MLGAVCGLNGLAEFFVDQGVDATDEKAGDTRHRTQVPTLLSELLQAVQIRLGNRFIRLDRKEQGHIDIDPLTDQLGDGRNTGLGGRHLNHDVGPIDHFVQAPGFFEGRLRVMGQIGRDFKADIAIFALGFPVDLRQHVRGHADVLNRQTLIHVYGRPNPLFDQGLHGLIVIGTARQRLFKNSWIRRHAKEAVMIDHGLEITRSDKAAVDIVIPDTLTQLLDSNQWIFHALPRPSPSPQALVPFDFALLRSGQTYRVGSDMASAICTTHPLLA